MEENIPDPVDPLSYAADAEQSVLEEIARLDYLRVRARAQEFAWLYHSTVREDLSGVVSFRSSTRFVYCCYSFSYRAGSAGAVRDFVDPRHHHLHLYYNQSIVQDAPE